MSEIARIVGENSDQSGNVFVFHVVMVSIFELLLFHVCVMFCVHITSHTALQTIRFDSVLITYCHKMLSCVCFECCANRPVAIPSNTEAVYFLFVEAPKRLLGKRSPGGCGSRGLSYGALSLNINNSEGEMHQRSTVPNRLLTKQISILTLCTFFVGLFKYSSHQFSNFEK